MADGWLCVSSDLDEEEQERVRALNQVLHQMALSCRQIGRVGPARLSAKTHVPRLYILDCTVTACERGNPDARAGRIHRTY